MGNTARADYYTIMKGKEEIKVDKISVKMADTGYRSGSVSKSDSSVKAVTDDFRKLLQGQEQQTDSKEVSKKDTKAEDKTEKPAETKDEKTSKESGNSTKEVAEEEPVVQEKTTQTEVLLAAYQMNLNMCTEVIQAEPQIQEEILTPVVQTEGLLETAADAAVPQIQEAAGIQQSQLPTETAQPQNAIQDVTAEETDEPAAEIISTVTEIKAPERNNNSSGAEEQYNTQSGGHPAEQAVQAPAAQPHTEVQAVKPQEPVRMYVPQPEALPEKVTDQLLAKISEGVQEFEIHIEPANLGKIAVKILYQEGQATVSIFCSEKRALDVLGRNAGEIGQVIEKNLGGTTTIIVDKQENDYLNQQRDENQKNGQNPDNEQQKDNRQETSAEDADQFLQKLRLGLTG